MLWLSSTPVMTIQPFPATLFPIVKLSQIVKSAALLAEALLLAGDDDHRRLGVGLADLVAAVVVAAPAEVRSAPVYRASLRAYALPSPALLVGAGLVTAKRWTSPTQKSYSAAAFVEDNGCHHAPRSRFHGRGRRRSLHAHKKSFSNRAASSSVLFP